MRRGIVFGTDGRGERFAVVGDGCEGRVVCEWITWYELLFEFMIHGLSSFRYLDGIVNVSYEFFEEVGQKYAKHMIDMLPVINDELEYSSKVLREHKGITEVSVNVSFDVCSEALWYGLPLVFGKSYERGFEGIIVLDYSENERYMPFWKSVGCGSDAYEFLTGEDAVEGSEAFENFKKFVKEYEIVEWSGFVQSSPLMSILENGNICACRNNPYNSLSFLRKYGVEESVVFRYPLMDHPIIFKNRSGGVVIVVNPYLSDAEVTQYMDCLERSSVVSGDYTKLKYEVLGKKNHIYSNANCNVVLFHL